MSVNCTSCGHPIPSGQFRCGKCGEAQARDSVEDFDNLGEVTGDAHGLAAEGALHLGVGPETGTRALPRGLLPGEPRKRPEQAAPVLETARETSEEDARRPESLVPKGTFATDSAAASKEAEAVRPLKIEVPAERAMTAPRPDATTMRVATSAGSSQPRRARKVAPPFLASAILREDLAPSEPGKQRLSRTLLLGGVTGLIAALLVEGGRATLLFAPLFLAFIALSRVSVSYVTRALIAGSIGGLGLGAATFWRVSLGGNLEGPFLAASLTLLAAALYFRAWYRASALARALVGASLLLCLSWAALTSHRGLLELGFDWTSWLPALTWYLFVILCLLSLLAFMGDETTGGCDAWGTGLFLWFGLHAAVRYASEPSASATQALLGLIEPVLAGVAGVCLAQLLARALGPRTRRVEQALTS